MGSFCGVGKGLLIARLWIAPRSPENLKFSLPWLRKSALSPGGQEGFRRSSRK